MCIIDLEFEHPMQRTNYKFVLHLCTTSFQLVPASRSNRRPRRTTFFRKYMSGFDSKLAPYIRQFSKLRTDRSADWTGATRNQAPHKPFLLLSLLDLVAEGRILTNLVEITLELVETFAGYWEIVLPNRRGDIALPFFHLRTSKFWQLVPKPGQEAALAAANRGYSIGQLQRMLLGARLDEQLFTLLQHEEPRDALRTVLIQTYFSAQYHGKLLEQGHINLQAFLYSQQLLERSRKSIKDIEIEDSDYSPDVRSQGFRKAVVGVYNHRCAFCGVRVLTSAGHTAVDAAHIIPWQVSHDDNVRNGMALCRLCHWTFDEGLAAVSAIYQVLLSSELRTMHNIPGHLITVQNRRILGPEEDDLWPAPDSIAWHRRNVFISG